jgi:protein TonB
VIEVFTDPVKPPELPLPVPLPAAAPVLPTIAVPPLPDNFPVAPAQTTLSTRQLSDGPPPAASATGGPAVAPTPRTPVQVAAVVDASGCTRPDYPKNALRNGDTGTVMLAFLIGTDGRVVESRIEKSSGFRELDRAAQTGLTLCRFQPGTIDGVPQQSWTRMQYVWSLDS